MSILDIVEIDLPLILLIILKWILDQIRNRRVERTLDEVKARVSGR